MTPLAILDVSGAVAWLEAIPLSEWPQQHRLADGVLRPAMVTDLAWKGFGEATQSIERAVMRLFEGCVPVWRALSVVMPGHAIPTHCDEHSDDRICRAHVPLTTNPDALFIVNEMVHRLEVGRA